MTSFRRLPQGGRINRTQPLAFTYNGKSLQGFAGDTIASALLANNQVIIARSFKYHRPRGIVSAGIEEPNALFTLGEAASTVPNTIGSTTALRSGMNLKSQNAWPSPTFDLMAVNSLAGPLFSAGFYYKTFMGPFKRSWMFYEPFIRKAAGLGAATEAWTDERYDTTNSFCDVLIIGSGPAGLAAAITVGRAGARVVLVEQDQEPGGALLFARLESLESWRKDTVTELDALENVRVMCNATVQGLYDHNQVIISIASNKLEVVQAKTIIHATGALERPLVFNNNDRPGVMSLHLCAAI
jgi:methylglutamate dehydrogenase subunit C